MSYGTPYSSPYGASTVLIHSDGYQASQWRNSIARMTDLFKIVVNSDGTFEGPQNIGDLFQAKAISQQHIEDFIDMFLKTANIDNANGWLLAVIGKYFGITQKNTEADIAFQRRIRANIIANSSKGTGKDIFDLVNLMVDDNDFCQIRQYTPNTFIVTTDGSVTDPVDYKKLVDRATGDVYQNAIGIVDGETPFNFASARSLANRQAAPSGAATVCRVIKSNCLKENYGAKILGGQTGTAGAAYFIVSGSSIDATDFRPVDLLYYAGDTTPAADGSYTIFKSVYQGADIFWVYVRETIISTAVFDGTTMGVGIEAGEFAGGEICVLAGTSSSDVRTIDPTGAFLGTAGYWDFTVTDGFTATLDATSFVNLIDYPNLGFAGLNSYSNIQVSAGTLPFQVAILQASFTPAIIAGDFANGQITIIEGANNNERGNVRIITSDGAIASGAYWVFEVTEPFNADTITTANFVNITDDQSFLGYSIS